MASKSLMAPPDAAAAKLIEPEPSAKAAATPAPVAAGARVNGIRASTCTSST